MHLKLSRSSRVLKNRGFALIVTLSLLILLTVIAVGMLSLATISLRGSSGSDMATARANARMALMLAIGDLQKYTGPDQRVTANADILSEPTDEVSENGHWTGVWSTTLPTAVDLTQTNLISDQNPPDPTKGVVTGGANPGRKDMTPENPPDRNYLTDFRNETKSDGSPGYTKKSLMLAWLVSGNPSVSVKPSVSSAGTPHVTMVGKKALGLDDNVAETDPFYQANRVTAPAVEINKGTANAGRYAYWIGDESQKARVNLKPTDKQPDASSPTDGGLARLTGAEGPNARYVKAGTAQPYGPLADLQAADQKKLVTPGELTIPIQSSTPKKNFHDLTTYSESVLADVRDGGLKKDLTSYITQPGTAEVAGIPGIPGSGMPNPKSGESGNPLPGRPMLPGSYYAKSGPNFLQLRNWYQLSNKVTGGYGKDSYMNPVFLKTRTSNAWYAATYGGDMPDLQSRDQSVQPVVVEARIAFDFSRGSGTGDVPLKTHVYPRVKLWNPYNVTLKGRRYLIGFPKYINLNVNTAGVSVKRASNGGVADWRTYFTNDPSDANLSKVGQLYFSLESVDLQPGECLIFSPSTVGQSKYETTDITANVLSPSGDPTSTNNFYFNSDACLTGVISANVAYGITSSAGPVDPVQNKVHPARAYLFKDADGSGSIDDVAAQKLPIIQKLAMDGCGDSSAGGSLPYPTGAKSNMDLFGSHANTVPLASWYMGARLRWIDEDVNESTQGRYGSYWPGRYSLDSPIVRGFNIRANVVHRSQFCHADIQWGGGGVMFWWTVGPYINSVVSQPITAASMGGNSSNGKWLGSPFGLTSNFPVENRYVMFDVPRKELAPMSLASFQHAQLGYQAWQPTYMVGNSFASAFSDRDSTVLSRVLMNSSQGNNFRSTNWYSAISWAYYSIFKSNVPLWGPKFGNGSYGNWSDLVQLDPNNANDKELLIYDSSYAVNYALWDRYFLSSLPFDAQGKLQASGGTMDPANPRMKVSPYSEYSDSQINDLLAGDHPFDYAAYFLMNEGGFNINSTSVEAWRAFFTSMNDVKRPIRSGGTESVTGAFSRLLLPGTTTAVGDHNSTGAWDGVRVLNETDIDIMAQSMVNIIKERGPFLGLSDFVNRRLTFLKYIGDWLDKGNDPNRHPSMCGPLQLAIEKANLNASLHTTNAPTNDTASPDTLPTRMTFLFGGQTYNPALMISPDGYAMGPWKSQSLPGSLTQADVLQSVGANITARGDTFIVRAYGDKRDANGNLLAKAWCEAVVQRTPDFISSKPVEVMSDGAANNPLEPVVTHNPNEYSTQSNCKSINPQGKLIPMNEKYGRRYVIKSFRWLTSSEV